MSITNLMLLKEILESVEDLPPTHEDEHKQFTILTLHYITYSYIFTVYN